MLLHSVPRILAYKATSSLVQTRDEPRAAPPTRCKNPLGRQRCLLRVLHGFYTLEHRLPDVGSMAAPHRFCALGDRLHFFTRAARKQFPASTTEHLDPHADS